MTTKNWVTVPSEHDVYREYRHTTGRQISMQNKLFIATMTREDVAKITLQLIAAQCAETAISEGEGMRRTLNRILEERAFGELSFLVCRT